MHEHLGSVSQRPTHQGLSRRWPNVRLSDGYESDSTLIRKTGRRIEVEPEQQKAWYKEIQKGGEIPLTGLRKTAPEKPAKSRFDKPQSVLDAKHPSSNHNHVPNSAPKLTPACIFRSNPHQVFRQTLTMSARRVPPTPPVRFSSKGISRRFSLGEADRYSASSSDTFDAGIKSHYDTFKKDSGWGHPLYRGFSSSEDIRRSNLTNFDYPKLHYQYENWNHPLLSCCDKSHQRSLSATPQRQSYHTEAREVIGFDDPRSQTRSNRNNDNPHYSSEIRAYSNSPRSEQDRYVSYNQKPCMLFREHEPSTSFNSSRDFKPSAGNYSRLEFRQSFSNEANHWKQFYQNVSNSVAACDGRIEPPVDYLQQSSITKKKTVKCLYKDFGCSESVSTEWNVTPRDNYMPSTRILLENPNDILFMKTTNNDLKYSPSFVTDSIDRFNPFTPQDDTFNAGHLAANRKNEKSKENYKVINSNKSIQQNGIKKNCSNDSKISVEENSINASFVPFPVSRMITIMPPSFSFFNISNTEVELNLAHSELLTHEKHVCKVDLNPLKLYLKGVTVKGENTCDHYNYIDNRDSNTTMFNNQKLHQTSNMNFKEQSLNHNKYPMKVFPSPPSITQAVVDDHINDLMNVNRNKCPSILNITSDSFQAHNSTVLSPFLKNRKNIFSNQSNVILYHQYIASMVHSITKSRKFIFLKNFFANLENINNNLSSSTSKHDIFGRTRYGFCLRGHQQHQKWDKERDNSLRVKHSSVEDLKKLFQNQEQAKSSQSRHQISFHYKKLWYNVSVSSLVKKYNSMQCVSESLTLQMTSCISQNKFNMLSSNVCNPSKPCTSPSFPKIPFNVFSTYIDVPALKFTPSVKQNVASPSTRSSVSDISTSSFRKKVQYYEDISLTKKEHYFTRNMSPDYTKFGHSRNLSWSDLRNIDNSCPTANNRCVFSPQYLPEKAMSCLNLSFVSDSSHTVGEPSLTNSTHSSSTVSCSSQNVLETQNTIHPVKTGTVARIKNRLEKMVNLSRSHSLPHNITSESVLQRYISKRSKLLRKKSGSVQDLKQLFESSNNDKLQIKDQRSDCTANLKTRSQDRSHSEKLVNSSDSCEEASGNNVFSIEKYIKKRIQRLIAKFESSTACDASSGMVLKKGMKSSSQSTQFKRSTESPSRENILLKAESFVEESDFSATDGHQTASENSQPCLQGKLLFHNGNSPFRLAKWTKCVPAVRRNGFPQPYVKAGPLKMRLTASPHQYQETEVNIHYRSPIRYQEKEYIEEEELRKRQEDAMRKFYEEERRKKHQQELAEIEMRRHSDFFTPSQKSPISLNRYDNPFESNFGNKVIHRGPPPKTMARAVFPFVAQTTRELSLNKGDIVYIQKQVDKNWFEGEHHGLIGIFPSTYVEIIPNEKANLQPRKSIEGEAMVKYNFRALTPVELSLFKGEKVVLTRRMDRNWYEGRLGTKKGIFPASYVHVLREPGDFNYGSRSISPRPPSTSPVYSPVINGPTFKTDRSTYHTGLPPMQDKPPLNMERIDTKSSITQSLHIDTYNEPIPYRSLYSYKPQNDDELELKEGDTVYVMEKCDDGWYVGTSLRTGLFGTFPGNYVERI